MSLQLSQQRLSLRARPSRTAREIKFFVERQERDPGLGRLDRITEDRIEIGDVNSFAYP